MDELSELLVESDGNIIEADWLPFIAKIQEASKNGKWIPIVSAAPIKWEFVGQSFRNRGRKRIRTAMRIAFNWRQPIPKY